MHAVLLSYVVRPSLRLFVTLMYRRHRPIGWTSSELIPRIISLGSSFLGGSEEPQHRQSSPRRTPLKFGWKSWNRGGGSSQQQPAISLKWGKIGPRLLVMTNRKSHTRFRLVPKSTTLDDLEGPLRTVFQNTCVFRSTPRKSE